VEKEINIIRIVIVNSYWRFKKALQLKS